MEGQWLFFFLGVVVIFATSTTFTRPCGQVYGRALVMTSKRRRTIEVEVHRRKPEFLWMFRKFARDRDDAGFKAYLSDHLDIQPDDPEYSAAMREFWNLVRALENEPRR